MSNRIQKLLTAYVNRVQEYEDAVWTWLSSMTVDAATGDLLDKIGKLAGEARGGRSDTDYRQAVRLRIRVNRSKGKAIDLVDVAILAAGSTTGAAYSEGGIASWDVTILNLKGPLSVLTMLGKAAAAGTSGTLTFSIDANEVFGLDDSVTTLTSASLLPDEVSGSPAVYLGSCQVAK